MPYFTIDGQPIHMRAGDIEACPPMPDFETLAKSLDVCIRKRHTHLLPIECKAAAIAVLRASRGIPMFYSEAWVSVVAYPHRVEIYYYPLDFDDYIRDCTIRDRFGATDFTGARTANDASP